MDGDNVGRKERFRYALVSGTPQFLAASNRKQ